MVRSGGWKRKRHCTTDEGPRHGRQSGFAAWGLAGVGRVWCHSASSQIVIVASNDGFRCLGSRVGQWELLMKLPPPPSLACYGMLFRYRVLCCGRRGHSSRRGGAERLGCDGARAFRLLNGKDWEAGRRLSFQLRTNRAANTLLDRPRPCRSSLGCAMRHEALQGCQRISAGSEKLVGHPWWALQTQFPLPCWMLPS
ncbi:hypothetical protein VTK56DRAFT_3166 [Thermocarpiscus australiensis]